MIPDMKLPKISAKAFHFSQAFFQMGMKLKEGVDEGSQDRSLSHDQDKPEQKQDQKHGDHPPEFSFPKEFEKSADDLELAFDFLQPFRDKIHVACWL